MNNVEEKIQEGIKIIKETYGWNLHSIWLVGSCAKDYPNLKEEYLDVDLLTFTYTRTAKRISRIYGDIDIDFGNVWFIRLFRIIQKKRLKNNLTRYQQKEFNKYAVRLL